MRRILFTTLVLIAAFPANAAETVTYQYDALGRLVQATHQGGTASGVTAVYTMDANGNRINVKVIGASS